MLVSEGLLQQLIIRDFLPLMKAQSYDSRAIGIRAVAPAAELVYAFFRTREYEADDATPRKEIYSEANGLAGHHQSSFRRISGRSGNLIHDLGGSRIVGVAIEHKGL